MPLESPLRDGRAPGYDLIETLRWEPDVGFARLDRHLARLHASAQVLGFRAAPETIGEALKGVAKGTTALRARLSLAPDGKVSATAQPYVPANPDVIWTVCIAATQLDGNDPLLRHKTTRRAVYDAARAEHARDRADEVLLFNQYGEACEGTITNLFVDIGEPVLLTPPVSSGLLPGILRGELIENGAAREAIITESDLRRAARMFVGNSLRGMIPARLI